MKKKKTKSSLKDRILISIFSVVITLSVLSVVGVFLFNTSFLENNEPDTGNDNKLDQDIITPNEIRDKAVNILVVGIDYTEKAGSNRGKLTDMIMVANFDMAAGKINALRIPRDSYIGEDISTGKINAVYGSKSSGGIDGLAKRINKTLDLTIDHYVTVNMDGFVNIVNAIGGVEMDVPISFYLEGVKIEKGLQTLNGIQAEKVVRERYSYPTGDFGRIDMQNQFMQALIKKCFGMSKTQIVSMAPTLIKEVTTDLTLGELLGYYNELMKVDMSNISFHILPTNSAWKNGLAMQSIQREQTADLLNAYFRPYSDPVPAEELGILELKSEAPPAKTPVSSQETLPEESQPEEPVSSEIIFEDDPQPPGEESSGQGELPPEWDEELIDPPQEDDYGNID